MPAISRHQLYRIRNQIPIDHLIRNVCQWPCKQSEGYFRFLCPSCSEMHTATNPDTNLARCFRCQKNFNPIDWVIELRQCSFLDAIAILEPLLSVNSSDKTDKTFRDLSVQNF